MSLPMAATVLPFVTWLANDRHRTAAHAFVPNRSLSVCKLARRVGENWQAPLADTSRCKKCEHEVAGMAQRRGRA